MFGKFSSSSALQFHQPPKNVHNSTPSSGKLLPRVNSIYKPNKKVNIQKKSQSRSTDFIPVITPNMIPEPDYDEDGSDCPKDTSSTACSHQQMKGSSHSSDKNSRFNENGLITPKKLNNPCLECTERQNVHRELLFNHKIGKSVLGQKSELQKAMDKFSDDQKRKQIHQERVSKRSSFEKRLEEQANKLKQNSETETEEKSDALDDNEFKMLHAKLVTKS